MWCQMGRCTEIGERPEAIDGEWGQWEPWSPCSRTCGAGVSLSQRHCDNPYASWRWKILYWRKKALQNVQHSGEREEVAKSSYVASRGFAHNVGAKCDFNVDGSLGPHMQGNVVSAI
ncbi:hypothetical protein CEXT_531631 [Caerostris extrusa]|uniref:Uncharacterized protein n=1 Tax=Caerostris extrusa TaxID=172846 RepID=A0AAV4XFX3_CAEEX|nr:hypothetical protein CEXT_531631 [Caerostris extrusa]